MIGPVMDWFGIGSVKDCLTLLGTILGTSFVLSHLCYFMVSVCEPTYVKLAFENGQQQYNLKTECYVNRSTLTQTLAATMAMQSSGVYHLVNGPHGCESQQP